jgi:CcmD family protein
VAGVTGARPRAGSPELRSAVVNKYLFLAYAFVWIIFMVYAWSLSRRQSRLLKEMKELKSQTESAKASRE